MDPMTLAATVVAALAPFLGKFTDGALTRAGEAAADTAGAKIGALYRAVRKRMTGDGYHQAILQGAEDKPDNPARLDALTGTIGSILQEDPEFAVTLTELLEQVTGSQDFQVSESGIVAGRDVHQTGTYVAGRDLTIGS